MAETFIPRSSNIDRVEYDEPTKLLTITFKEGRSWEYSGVSRETFRGLQHAPSAGSYFFRQIRGRFPEAEV